MKTDIVRDTAIDLLLKVFNKGAYLGLALDSALERRKLSPRGRRFLTQLVYGTVRHKTLCDHVLSGKLRQPPDELPAPILMILRLGVFQTLFCNQVTFPAMVSTSVDLAHKWGHAGTARLVNAVLRHIPDSLNRVGFPGIAHDPVAYLTLRHSMPQWLVELWIEQHGVEQAEALCLATNTEAEPTIRVNTLRTTTDRLANALAGKGFGVEKRTPVPEELTLTEGLPPARSKLFDAGLYLVQDTASMLPPHLLEPQGGERILDLCAAPGGKTTHLAALTGGKAHITAVELHPGRLGLIAQNAARLSTPGIDLVCADGASAPFGSGLFDRVLVDAPCTGLGTLRRHPDLKWRVAADDPARMAAQQLTLLRSAVRLCKNGGLIVYSVCTFTGPETRQVVHALVRTENVKPEDGPEWLNQWKIEKGQYQTQPTNGALDGFFLTRLRKGS